VYVLRQAYDWRCSREVPVSGEGSKRVCYEAHDDGSVTDGCDRDTLRAELDAARASLALVTRERDEARAKVKDLRATVDRLWATSQDRP
jgi:hypothetical protein